VPRALLVHRASRDLLGHILGSPAIFKALFDVFVLPFPFGTPGFLRHVGELSLVSGWANAAPGKGHPMGAVHHDEYAEASAQRELTEDFAEQGIDLTRRDGVVQLRGHVETEERRDAIGERVKKHFPHSEVRNDIVVVRATPPTEAEEVR